MIIPHSRPLIDDEDVKAVSDVVASGKISQSEKVREFEAKLASFVGTKYGAATSSGTSAIHLALTGLGVKAGDEIIIPSYVCAGPYMAILHAGAVPKIADLGVSEFNTNAAMIKRRVTFKTKAVIVPHMFGTPAEIEEIVDLGIPVIEDCAQSLGAQCRTRRVGSFGRLCICSFFATKMITTGEGGMVLTNDNEIYDKIVDIREYDKKPLNAVRFNYKMSDISAALGLSQLKKLLRFIERRREIAAIYDERFSRHNVILPRTHPSSTSVFYRYVIMVSKLKSTQRMARKSGVICERPVWKPLHQLLHSTGFPNSDYIYDHALSVPLYPSLKEEEVEHVAKTLSTIFKETDASMC